MKTETVVRVRPALSGRDENGDWVSSSQSRLDIPGCKIAPRVATESTDRARQGVVVGLTLYAPAGTEILATDQVEARGVLYEVEGEPGDWRGTTISGLEVALRRAAG